MLKVSNNDEQVFYLASSKLAVNFLNIWQKFTLNLSFMKEVVFPDIVLKLTTL